MFVALHPEPSSPGFWHDILSHTEHVYCFNCVIEVGIGTATPDLAQFLQELSHFHASPLIQET